MTGFAHVHRSSVHRLKNVCNWALATGCFYLYVDAKFLTFASGVTGPAKNCAERMTAFGSRGSQPERPALGGSGMAGMGRIADAEVDAYTT